MVLGMDMLTKTSTGAEKWQIVQSMHQHSSCFHRFCQCASWNALAMPIFCIDINGCI